MFVRYLSILAFVLVGLFAAPQDANAKIRHYLFGTYDDGLDPQPKKVFAKKHKQNLKYVKAAKVSKATKAKLAHKKTKKKSHKAVLRKPAQSAIVAALPAKPAYAGREQVAFASQERPGTIIIKTQERALYEVLGHGRAMRYLVAVGKQGFTWSGVARVGMKRVNPPWTPPAEMIQRKPELAKWAAGIPGGDPQNPLGVRAMYLYKGKYDTGFRIHGTINPESIGTAASSGCIRMLNSEVIELFAQTPVGTKVIVI
ncbi:MAG: L,D-transpeptidase [Alphaproteobacteria bacterium]|nr:L,D-transpeptidase [Alphaproteobacteria bacterium]